MSAKAIDYQDILTQIKSLMGESYKLVLPNNKSILLADDLLPSQIKLLVNSNIKGVILKNASISSHSAILLKSYGIVSAIADVNIDNNTTVILDTLSVNLVINPNEDDKLTASNQAKVYEQKQAFVQILYSVKLI